MNLGRGSRGYSSAGKGMKAARCSTRLAFDLYRTRTHQAHKKRGNAVGATRRQLLSRASNSIIGHQRQKVNSTETPAASPQFAPTL